MKLQDKMRERREQGKAMLAVNFYNYETLRGVCEAFAEMQQPLILQASPGSVEYMGLEVAVHLAQSVSSEYDIDKWLHLDHARDPELIKRCLDAGFDSVMIDASEEPLNENIKITREIVGLAHSYKAQVEAELGYVPKLGQADRADGFTQPEEAARFVEETGIHALAVAIGSAHGFYKAVPSLDMERLSKIRAKTNAFLVLHGGSGISGESLREAAKRGICKINLATEVKAAFTRTIKQEINASEEIDLRFIFPPAIGAVRKLVKSKLKLII